MSEINCAPAKGEDNTRSKREELREDERWPEKLESSIELLRPAVHIDRGERLNGQAVIREGVDCLEGVLGPCIEGE